MDLRNALLLLYGASLLLSWLDITNIRPYAKYYIGLILFVLFLCVGALLFPFSPDYSMYTTHYYDFARKDFSFPESYDETIDYGFLAIFTIIKSFGGDVIDVYLCITLLVLLIYFSILRKYTTAFFTAAFLLISRQYELQNIIQIRQGLACAIILFSLQYVQQHDWKKFLLAVIIAGFIHKTLLVAILIYPMSLIHWDSKKTVILIIGSIVLCLFPLSDLFIEGLASIGLGTVKLMQYASTTEAANVKDTQLIANIISLSICIGLLLKFHANNYANIFISMLLLGMLIASSFSNFSIVSNRMSLIFRLAIPFAPALVMEECKGLRSKIVVMLLISIIGSLLAIRGYMNYSELY